MKGKDLTERIYRSMKNDLMLGRLDRDVMYNEQTFADMYGCSRTPAREAAGRLVNEGFLNKYPSKGYIVRVPDEPEIRELRECRLILESAVIDRIAARASDAEIEGLAALPEGGPDDILYVNNLRFHLRMAELAGNGKLSGMIEDLLYLLVRPLIASRYPSYADYAAKVREGKEALTPGHRAIVEALLERDAAKAKRLLKEDIYPGGY